MPVCLAVFSDDSALCDLLLNGLQIDRAGSGPSIVVIDRRMAGALRLCEDLTSSGNTGVVMVSVPDNVDAGVEALATGARGIVFDSQPLADVSRAVEVVAKGQVFAPRHVVVASWTRFKADAMRQKHVAGSELSERLSSREREVFRYAAVGLSNKELAERLLISEATVKVHLTHIFQKLGVRGRSELAAAYYGIIR